jgi:hypothetical protein
VGLARKLKSGGVDAVSVRGGLVMGSGIRNRKEERPRAEQEVMILLSVAPVMIDYTPTKRTCP